MDVEAVRRIRAFNRYYTALIGVLDRRILKSPWSLTEVRILYEIAHASGTNARRLKQALSVDEGYLSRTIDRLRTAGMVGRRRSTSDGRVMHLRLTAKGRAELERLESAAAGEIHALIEGLSREETAQVVSCMDRIEALLDKGRRAT